MEENKKKMISLSLTIVALLLVVVGATYAYFAAQIGNGASTDVNITAESVDSLTFTTGSPINLSITQENFKEGVGNKVVNTSATASLIAGKDKNASYDYNVYLDISKNELTYSNRKPKIPELILRITDPDGNKVTELKDLIYDSSIDGFDITTERGLIRIATLENITTTTNVEQTWNFEFTFVNLDINQTKNAGKSFKAEVIIQKERLADSLAEVCTNGDNLVGCVKTLSETSVPNASSIYLHNGTYKNDANDGSYRYSGVDKKVVKKYEAEYSSVQNIVSSCIDTIKDIDGWCVDYDETDAGFYNTYQEALNRAINDGYVEGNLVKNYVCFGSDAENCPEENLYRIIGVFDNQVKLIKRSFYSSVVPYDTNGENSWSTASVNTNILNSTYLNSLNINWKNKIADSRWNVGRIVYENHNPKEYYDLEMAFKEAVNTKIGLMYISDYGYGTIPTYWTANQHITTSAKYNWLYLDVDLNMNGEGEWLITSAAETSLLDAYKGAYGIVGYPRGTIDYFSSTTAMNIRPTFYLNSNITYVSGEGTYDNPYRIN